MKTKILFYCMLSVMLTVMNSCNSFLDITPEEIPSIDNAFRNRQEARKFLYGCYSYMPLFADAGSNPAMFGGDEAWYRDPSVGFSPRLWHIALGNQGSNAPIYNCFASKTDGELQGGTPMFTALSDCNIFLENIHLPYDLQEWERLIWTGEVKFLKAFYHFWLFRMYGPIPLIRENLPMDAPSGEVQRYREPVDKVVEYIVELLDEAIELLPDMIDNPSEDLGRPTKLIAMALKAQVLCYGASPLFNNNRDEPFASYTDNRGTHLFPQTDATEELRKWEKAAEALKAVIDYAHARNHALYDYSTTRDAIGLDPKTIYAMQVRGAATEPEEYNPEIIWADYNSNTIALQRACFAAYDNTQMYVDGKNYGVPMKIVEQFFTKNGVPIEEDREWAGVNFTDFRTATTDDRQYISQNQKTYALHFDREPRFYSSIFFDKGTNYGNGRLGDNTSNPNYMFVFSLELNVPNQPAHFFRTSTTGYIAKKMLYFRSSA
ncbi:MAG: RagB/SusD family nutrient uptake outer membrane protein, partial [Bacteroidales bacterium]|nr:RagB/SusD family nutrient uptake outer membrane protein [Bacteroidales bacterium]